MPVGRRRFLQGCLALAGLGLLAGCGAVPSPLAQPTKLPRVGVLRPTSATNAYTEDFRQGLRELGYVEGQNIRLEYRYGDNRPERLPGLAAELVNLPVDVIVTDGPGTQAARDATDTIPIVFALLADPVGGGFVASLAHPGGNLTGLSIFHPQLAGKRLELIRAIVPRVSRIAVLQGGLGWETTWRELQRAAGTLGIELHGLEPRTPAEIEQAFSVLAGAQPEAMMVFDSALFVDQQTRIVELAARSRLPAIYANRGYAEAGGLLAYGPSLSELFRRAASYVDKILKGAKPADLPVEQPTTFDLVINLRTAQALGLTIPSSVLQQATELIQ